MTIHSRWQVPIPEGSLQKWIFGSANDHLPDTKSFIDPEQPETNYVTLSNYRLLSKRVALGLLKAGLKEGDRVLTFSGNTIFFPCVFLGVLMAGGIFTGANPTFVARELAYQLKDSEASLLIVAEPALKTALAAAKEIGFPQDRIYVLGGQTPLAPELAASPNPGPGVKGRVNGIRHWTELLQGNLSQAQSWSWVEPRDPADTTCCLNCKKKHSSSSPNQLTTIQTALGLPGSPRASKSPIAPTSLMAPASSTRKTSTQKPAAGRGPASASCRSITPTDRRTSSPTALTRKPPSMLWPALTLSRCSNTFSATASPR